MFYFIFDLFSLPLVENIEIPADTFNEIEVVISNVAYIVPVKGLLLIISISLVLDNFTIIWSLILRIKSFIPSMGR